MQLGHSEGRIFSLVFYSYTLSEVSEQFLQSPMPLELHAIECQSVSSTSKLVSDTHDDTKIQDADKVAQMRQSKGVHLLPSLLSSSTNWYDIKSQDGYQYLGTFQVKFPQCLGDISAFPFYTQKDEHFLFNDIQLNKGKSRAPRTVKITISGIEELLNYLAVE